MNKENYVNNVATVELVVRKRKRLITFIYSYKVELVTQIIELEPGKRGFMIYILSIDHASLFLIVVRYARGKIP